MHSCLASGKMYGQRAGTPFRVTRMNKWRHACQVTSTFLKRDGQRVLTPVRGGLCRTNATEAHPTLGHVVQAEDTLWDMSLRYGVTMKSIREVNQMEPKSSIIIPGQRLKLPLTAVDKFPQEQPAAAPAAPGIAPAINAWQWAALPLLRQTTPTVQAKGSSPTDGSQTPQHAAPPQRGPVQPPSRPGDLWVGSQYVRATSTEELEDLMLSQGLPTAEKDTLLVVYIDKCRFCHESEGLIEEVAAGIAHDGGVQVLALHASSPARRFWVREVLEVRSFPTILALPRREPAVFKLTEASRSAPGILEFMNTVFRRSGTQELRLRAAPLPAASAVANSPAGKMDAGVASPSAALLALALVAGAAVVALSRAFSSGSATGDAPPRYRSALALAAAALAPVRIAWAVFDSAATSLRVSLAAVGRALRPDPGAAVSAAAAGTGGSGVVLAEADAAQEQASASAPGAGSATSADAGATQERSTAAAGAEASAGAAVTICADSTGGSASTPTTSGVSGKSSAATELEEPLERARAQRTTALTAVASGSQQSSERPIGSSAPHDTAEAPRTAGLSDGVSAGDGGSHGSGAVEAEASAGAASVPIVRATEGAARQASSTQGGSEPPTRQKAKSPAQLMALRFSRSAANGGDTSDSSTAPTRVNAEPLSQAERLPGAEHAASEPLEASAASPTASGSSALSSSTALSAEADAKATASAPARSGSAMQSTSQRSEGHPNDVPHLESATPRSAVGTPIPDTHSIPQPRSTVEYEPRGGGHGAAQHSASSSRTANTSSMTSRPSGARQSRRATSFLELVTNQPKLRQIDPQVLLQTWDDAGGDVDAIVDRLAAKGHIHVEDISKKAAADVEKKASPPAQPQPLQALTAAIQAATSQLEQDLKRVRNEQPAKK